MSKRFRQAILGWNLLDHDTMLCTRDFAMEERNVRSDSYSTDPGNKGDRFFSKSAEFIARLTFLSAPWIVSPSRQLFFTFNQDFSSNILICNVKDIF